MAAPQSKKGSRLSKSARREQLLDAAAKLLVERGASAVTMERVAEWAGVSKALPYSHFDNSDELLLALYDQVVSELGRRVVAALETTDPAADRIPLVVSVYLDTVAELGPVLGAVTAPGSRSADLAHGRERIGPRFLAWMLMEHFAVDKSRAKAAAPIMLAALTGAVTSWVDRVGTRAQVEEMSVAVVRALIE